MLAPNQNYISQQLAAWPHPNFHQITAFQERFPMNISQKPRSLFARINRTARLLPLTVAAGLFAAMPVHGEDATKPQAAAPAAASEQSKKMQEIQGVHAEYMELQKRISKINQDAVKAHPELQKEVQSFDDLVLSKMSSTGKSAKDDRDELIKMQEKLQNSETPASERETLMADFQKKAVAFRNAQNEAMKNPEVQAAQKKLMDDVMTAMKEKDPQIEQLMQQLQQKQQQLSQMMKDAGHMQ
jgi:chromosome segregation ATPase